MSVQLLLQLLCMIGNTQPCCSCMLTASFGNTRHLIFNATAKHAQKHHLQ